MATALIKTATMTRRAINSGARSIKTVLFVPIHHRSAPRLVWKQVDSSLRFDCTSVRYVSEAARARVSERKEAVKKTSSVEQRVMKIVGEKLGVKEEKVTKTASFIEDLGADSLEVVEIVMALEEEFDLEIPDEEIKWINNVGSAIQYFEARQA